MALALLSELSTEVGVQAVLAVLQDMLSQPAPCSEHRGKQNEISNTNIDCLKSSASFLKSVDSELRQVR